MATITRPLIHFINLGDYNAFSTYGRNCQSFNTRMQQASKLAKKSICEVHDSMQKHADKKKIQRNFDVLLTNS
jgi:hypothetical protein